MENDIYWLLRSSCFELSGDGKYGLFQLKSWWKDDIYLLFLSFPWYSRTWEIWFFVLWILWCPGASFGSRTPPIFGCQTRKLSATNQQWSLWQYTKHLLDMFPRFWIKWSSSFGKYSIFHPWQGFSANTFTSRNAILFIFWIPERPQIPWHVGQLSCLVTFI